MMKTIGKITICDWLTYGILNRGFFGKGDMQKEFEEAAFNLEKGEVSGIVQTASGVHLIERYAYSSLLLYNLCPVKFTRTTVRKLIGKQAGMIWMS